jgi:hypothetical protein
LLRTLFGTFKFHTLQMRNFESVKTTFKFQWLSLPPNTHRKKFVMYFILWSIEMCLCQTLLFPTSWNQITCQSFYILFHFISTDISAPVETRTDTERFRFLASALNPVLIETDNVEEDGKAAVTFTVCLSSEYNLSTRKLTLLDLHNELPNLDHLLRLKQKLWTLLHLIADPACKTAFKGSRTQSSE